MTTAVNRTVALFEHLAPDDIGRLGQIYAADARFVDPFNDVRAIEQIFGHMFETLEDPRFVIIRRLVGQHQCFLTWDFHYRFRRLRKGVAQSIHGASHKLLDADGLITLHRDYWDAALLYQALPVIGAPLRWLRRRVGA